MKGSSNEKHSNSSVTEFQLQADRLKRILNETIYKLGLLSRFHLLLEDDGAILRRYLPETEVDYILLVCQEGAAFSRQSVERRSDLILAYNMLEKINMYEKAINETATMIKVKHFGNVDSFDVHVAYVVDILFKSKPLTRYMDSLEKNTDPLITAFIDALIKLSQITDSRLNVSAEEELQKENDLKTAYRSSLILSEDIQELENQLEKQRHDLEEEHDRKKKILQDLSEKIRNIKDKAATEVKHAIYDSEVLMMKDYNMSAENQEFLAAEAAETTRQYENLLEQHIREEKILRAKRLKAEAQLANWVAKYDNDIGEKQAEYDELKQTYDLEKEEYMNLQDKFDEQEQEYELLMREKEEEETKIKEEKAWIFLQNRAATRIQRYWRAYRLRRLAKKKSKKGKKKPEKSGSASSAKGKPKKKERETTLKGGPDPNALLESKFNPELLAEIKQEHAFSKTDMVVDLKD